MGCVRRGGWTCGPWADHDIRAAGAPITLVGGFARAADTCLNPSFTAFSRCGTDDITIGGTGTCKQAYLDKNASIGTLKIAAGGTLAIADQAAQGEVELTTKGIDIQGGGTLKIGYPRVSDRHDQSRRSGDIEVYRPASWERSRPCYLHRHGR
jgi:hypothetical protein